MIVRTTVKVALKSLFAHKLRSFLAMLGIIIGVGSVISMLALAAGAQERVMQRISAMGTDLLVIRPGMRGHRGVAVGTQENLTLQDAEAILEKIGGIRQLAPVVRGGAQAKYMSKNTRTTVVGTTVTYLPVRNFEIERGRTFTEEEAERRARVAILGSATAKELFGDADPLDQTIKVKSVNFRVIGVLRSKGDQGWFNPDDQLLVPYTTAMKQLFGMLYVSEINVQSAAGADHRKLIDGITNLLRQRHRLREEEEDDFHVRAMSEILETASDVSRTFTILLGSIASISLLVGGIGIMNIMLVTVTERTREIGIRKAIGAKDRHILRQFLFEAVLMSGLGGVLGVGVGIGVAAAIGSFTEFTTAVRWGSVALSLTFAVMVGVFFGYYPAWRAAQLDPIEALRYE